MRSIFTSPMLYRLFAPWLLLLAGLSAHAQTDPLPSWNDGPAKKAIIDFVQATTTQGSPNFVLVPERIAVFDQDGTLWVEHPMYAQVMYSLESVPRVVKAKPELANVEPFKTVMSGNREAIAKLSEDDLFKILAATLTGMSVTEFQAEVKKWLAEAKDPLDLTDEEVDELMSLQGTGGPLTSFGVERFVELIERKRRLIQQVQAIAGTEYLDLLEKMVGLLYDKVQPYGDRI